MSQGQYRKLFQVRERERDRHFFIISTAQITSIKDKHLVCIYIYIYLTSQTHSNDTGVMAQLYASTNESSPKEGEKNVCNTLLQDWYNPLDIF